MASVGHLAAGLAHEIGNPIAALLGIEELLLDDENVGESARDLLMRMKKETERIHEIVRGLLEFARADHPMPESTAAEARAEVRTAIDDVLALVRAQKSFRHLSLEAEVVGSPAVALAEPRLAQVLLNLVLNAGAATSPSGHVFVRAREASDRRVRIEVEDDGPGVAPQVRARLFEPFVTTKEVGTGTGLGLAVCRGIVESAGGTIDFDGSYVDGARFVVLLPAAPS
jgi:signal transduction histidine kinase